MQLFAHQYVLDFYLLLADAADAVDHCVYFVDAVSQLESVAHEFEAFLLFVNNGYCFL